MAPAGGEGGLVARLGVRVFGALLALAVGAVAFTVLLVLVVSRWGPLATLDREVSLWLNERVGSSQAAAGALRTITDLGDPVTAVALLTLLTVVLLVRRLPRLAIWVAVTGLGIAVLEPLAKDLVGRARPSLPVEVAAASGNSFPSGHSLASFTTFTVLLLVVHPALSRSALRWATALVVVVIGAVGFSRVALGVHYVSDVLAGWALGAAWISLTALAFRVQKADRHGSVPPLRAGLEPAAGSALRPAPHSGRPLGAHPRRTAALLLGGWLVVLGLVTGFGLLLTRVWEDTVIGRIDRAVVRTLTDLGSPTLDSVVAGVTALGGTLTIIVVSLCSAVLAVAVLGRWRPVVFLAVALAGEVGVYLLVSRVLVPRERPEAGMEAGLLPAMASYPSGHAAAACTLYGAIGLLFFVHLRGPWRWWALVVPVALGLLVAISRLYRGVHYPTDVLGSALLAVTWLAVTYHVLLRAPAGRAAEEQAVGGAPQAGTTTVSARGSTVGTRRETESTASPSSS